MWEWPTRAPTTDPTSQGKRFHFRTNPAYHQVRLEAQLSKAEHDKGTSGRKKDVKNVHTGLQAKTTDLQQDHQQSLEMAWRFSCDLILQVGLVLCKRETFICDLTDFLTILRRKPWTANSQSDSQIVESFIRNLSALTTRTYSTFTYNVTLL